MTLHSIYQNIPRALTGIFLPELSVAQSDESPAH